MSGERRGGREPEARAELRGRLLGANPLADAAEPEVDPLDEWLAALDRVGERSSAHAPVKRAPGKRTAPRSTARPARRKSQRGRRPGRARVAVSSATAAAAPEPGSGLGVELRRIASVVGSEPARQLAELVEGLGDLDRFGLSRHALVRSFPFFYALHRLYFRVRSEGHANLPSGPAVLASNHGGLLPFDGAMVVIDTLLNTQPPRLPRAIVERWAGTLPYLNVFFARVGQVVGTHENFARLLRDGELVLVFPEGVEGIRKPVTQRYRLQHFHVGFVEHALRERAPIVPMAVLGADDQAPILFDVKPLARALGLPAAPITPTFPWLGPLGLLPYPVRYRIVYGEPLHFEERFGPEAARDTSLVRGLANQVRRQVQALMDRHR
ncbi:MAG: lysophospholipid acyltransferase family protein [Myxococcota bacterium]|nr:lysophospholipid acyltransferase family protein [Myxococcota bacterium]